MTRRYTPAVCGVSVHNIVLFVIILILILLGVTICKNVAAIVALNALHKTKGTNGVVGGFKGKPEGVENILLVDVANMYVGWYMEKHKKALPYNQQQGLMDGYLDCMRDHYKKFVEKNNTETDAVNYILKNYKYSLGKSKGMFTAAISNETWEKIYEFVKKRPGAHVTVAEDYRQIPHTKWKSPKMHYLRGRDDYLCFRMAQHYKKKYINTVIMSDDKYRDYEQFGFVPEFLATYVHTEWGEKDDDLQVVKSDELVKPKPNILGQMKDYKMVRITTAFAFRDPKFLKSSEYKIAEPGHVWD